MKKHFNFKSMYRAALVALCLITVGVGQMWATARTFKSGERIYFKDAAVINGSCMKYSDTDLWAVFEGTGDWIKASIATGSWNAAGTIYYFDVPGSGQEYDFVIFTRNDWNIQTGNEAPDTGRNMFVLTTYNGNKTVSGYWDRYVPGSAVLGTFNNWDPDRGVITDGRIILELEASTDYEFKVLMGDGTSLDNWYGLNSGTITNTTSSWWGLKAKENNCHMTSGEAGEYCFHWNSSSHYIGVYYPQTRFSASQYIYFNVEGETGWKTLGDKVMFWTKYYDSDGNNPAGGLSCNTPVETYVYYAQIPNNEYLGKVQLNRYDGDTWKASSAVAYAYNRSSSSQNCMIEESGKESAAGNGDWTPQWTTYCPPTTSETFADNSTTKISWQPNTNDGSTSDKAIWVKTGTTLKVTANASKAVSDPNMTVKYDFDVNSGSTTTQTTGAYTATASTNNTQYAVNAKMYTNYNLDNTASSTKHTHTIYYKALDTYSVTHTLSGVTKASGRAGDDAAAYHVAYDATYTANAGYYLPSDITVTIGGVTKTKGTDYTWTVTDGTSGTLNILSNKISGNVVVTINGIWRWSVAGSWKVITPGEGDPYWDPDTYAMGTITKVSSDDVCSVEVTLSANTNYTFKIADRAANPYEYWENNTSTFYMTYGNSSNWTFGNDASNTAACGLTTAGAGTYTFTYNITQHKVSVTYPTSYQVTAAGNPAAGGTVTPSSATYMSTSVGGEITATPNYSHYFNGWTSNAGGTFVTNTATATFKPSATSTVTAAFAERTAFIEGNFQVYNSDRSVRTKTGNAWQDASTTIKMTYDAGNNRYYLHTYSTPTELREQLNDAGAFFYVKTSTSSSSIADAATYKAYSSAAQSLSEYGSSHSLLVTTGESEHGFKFTGSEDGYVIIYFNGTSVWYELECALSYYGGDGATGDDPASRTYYAYGSNQTAASNTYSKTGYSFDHWDTAADDSGSDYAAGATNVAMNAREVCLHAQWEANDYTINLANMEATTAGTESVTVTFDASTNMTASDVITKPTKTHYDFGGYWTSENTGATLDHQLIGADGKWIKDVEGYTSHDGSGNPTWVHDYPISLYAKWTEHEYAVTLAVSPAGAGTTSPASSTTAKYVTASGDITATPSPGYSFREWGFSETGTGNYDVYVSDGSSYSSTDATIRIKAQHDGTLTANFTPKTYTVRFENLGADAGHKGSLDTTVTFNDTINMKGGIEVPSKSHYDFGGYYTSTDKGATLTNIQIIDANGNWNKDVSGYTGTKDNVASWVCAGDTVLYAKWTETPYTITMAVSPAGTGTTSPASTATGKLVTESGNITATPAAGYKFKEWQFSKTGEAYDAWCADGYSSTDATIHIKAQHNGTLTAVFEERYSLVGSLQDNTGNGGMPGWEDYSKTFTVNSSSPVDLTRTCTLQANKTYKLQVHDLATSTNLGRSGCDPVCVLEENASLVMENSNNDVFLYTGGAGEYIFKITAVDGSGHPTLTVLRPYPVNFGQKYQDIDGTLHAGTTGGTAAATAGSALSSGDYVTYNTSVTHTATPETGYTFAGWWGSDAFEGDAFTDYNPWYNTVTSGDNAYAKFTEDSKSVTISKTGNGTITVGGSNFTWGNTTTCGVTTTRRLVATGDPGYRLSSWTVPDGVNFQLEDKASDTDNDVTLRGKASGSAGTLTANFVERYSIKGTMNGENWGTTHTLSNIGTNAGSKDTCYVTMTLPANTTYEFAIYDEQTGGWLKNSTSEVFKMTYTNHTNWGFGTDKTVNCGITTAGKGTYKFIFNITDKTVTVVYPTSYQVNYGASPSVGGNITVVDGDENAVPNGGYVVAGGSVTYTAAAASGYTFVGWCNNDSYGNTFNNDVSWTDGTLAATSNSYAKFKSTNFVIYRTGDMSSDPRAAYDDVESYAGGTISEKIEYRMKVHELDKWYTLCLPFALDSVGVWDNDDKEYYDIEPYYRTEVGGTLYGGHYIIRTPKQATDLPITEFGDWRDPESADGYVPSANTPYIIQWHMYYFLNKYISFFGASGQTIPTSMTAGSAPSSDNVVNVCVNNSMTTGSAKGAYLLDPDYGDGAWLRAENADDDRTILPFECYLLANNTTRAKYRVIRRDMTITDTPTGWDDVLNSERKAQIMVYTISGFLVTQLKDCSFAEAAQRLRKEHNEGFFILRSENESVKLMLGGK